VVHLSQPKAPAVTITTLTPFSFPEEFNQAPVFTKLFFGGCLQYNRRLSKWTALWRCAEVAKALKQDIKGLMADVVMGMELPIDGGAANRRLEGLIVGMAPEHARASIEEKFFGNNNRLPALSNGGGTASFGCARVAVDDRTRCASPFL